MIQLEIKKLTIFIFLILTFCSFFNTQVCAKEFRGGKFLLTAQVGKGWEIFVVNDDGTGEKQVSSTGGKASKPKWSPDGSKFSFRCERELRLMDSKYKDLGKIEIKDASIDDFDWSPDSKRILFSIEAGINEGIYEKNLNGSAIKQLVGLKELKKPQYSPDGSMIAFLRSSLVEPRTTSYQVVVVDSKTGEKIIQTHFDGNEALLRLSPGGNYYLSELYDMRWSSDSKRVSFGRSERDGYSGISDYIYLFDVHSGVCRKWGERGDEQLSFSVDKNIAVFLASESTGMYVSNLRGKNRRRLTKSRHGFLHPELILSGTKIVFVSNQDTHQFYGSLYVMDIDGKSEKRISGLILNSYWPYSWHEGN